MKKIISIIINTKGVFDVTTTCSLTSDLIGKPIIYFGPENDKNNLREDMRNFLSDFKKSTNEAKNKLGYGETTAQY